MIERKVNKRILLDVVRIGGKLEYRAVVCEMILLRGGTVIGEVIGEIKGTTRQVTISRDVAEIRVIKLGGGTCRKTYIRYPLFILESTSSCYFPETGKKD